VLVKGMLESSRKNPAKRSITVESVRLLTADVALADGRYIQKGQAGGKDREMCTAITLKRGVDGWRIAAIRNMLPASQSPSRSQSEAARPEWGRATSDGEEDTQYSGASAIGGGKG
jgi:hypothetical protein